MNATFRIAVYQHAETGQRQTKVELYRECYLGYVPPIGMMIGCEKVGGIFADVSTPDDFLVVMLPHRTVSAEEFGTVLAKKQDEGWRIIEAATP